MKRFNKTVLLTLCVLFAISLLCSCGGGGGGGGSSDNYGEPKGKSSVATGVAFPDGFYGYWKDVNDSNKIVLIAPNSYTEFAVSGSTMKATASYNCAITAGESGTVTLSGANYRTSAFAYTLSAAKLTLSNTRSGAELTKLGASVPYTITK